MLLANQNTARPIGVNSFRPEIAGLRAIAVIGVVLFHLKISGFQGGFVGVDVFFVISGYLITRNILLDLQADRFSFGQFYLRRTRRIYPALIFTVAATYIAGALWCAPLMFLDLAKESTHALLSIANIQYWRESHRYFAPNSDELALLHFWSLSLEEQFYLLWPLFIVAARRTGSTFTAIFVAALASLVGSIIVAGHDPTAVFFLMPFRIFEFGIGAFVLLLERRHRLDGQAAEALSGGGIICIAASAILFDPDMSHLETAILLPCLGGAAVIWAGGRTTTSRILTNPTMMGIGAISYSLYLCHWPIIFFTRFIFGNAADAPTSVLLMAVVMIVVATAMYFLVERRFIQPSSFKLTSFWKAAAAFWLVLLPMVAVTHLTFLSGGLPWRLPKLSAELVRLQSFPSSSDLGGLSGPVAVQFVGDSLALQYEYGLLPTMKSLNVSFEALGGAGCPILYGVSLSKSIRRDDCIRARDEALQRLADSTLPVIYVQYWKYYDDAAIDSDLPGSEHVPATTGSFSKLRTALEVTIGRLVARGHRVLLIGTQVDPGCPINVPRIGQGPLPHANVTCPSTSPGEARRSLTTTDAILFDVQARWPDEVKLMRPVDYFCDAECPVVKDGIWLYNSRTHLSLAGSDYLVARSGKVFHQFLTETR